MIVLQRPDCRNHGHRHLSTTAPGAQINDLHIPTAFLLVGIMLLVMPIFTWLSLSRTPSEKLRLWCSSGIFFGCSAILFGLRLHLPDWAAYPLTNFFMFLGCFVRMQSLRHEASTPWPGRWVVAGVVCPIVIFEFIRLVLDDVTIRLIYTHVMHAALIGYIAFLAWQVGQKLTSRSARMMSAFHALLAGAFLLRLAEIVGGLFSPDMMMPTYGGIAIAVSALLVGAVSHIAYVGMQYELTHEKLTTAKGEYQGMLDTTPDGFVVADADGRFLDANESYCRMLGYARSDLQGLGLPDVRVADETERVSEVLRQQREQGFTRYETRHRRRDGTVLDVEESVTYMPAPENKFLVFIRDISERKWAQLELERRVVARTLELATARAEAESANAVNTRFMANVSHEMRTPMNGILGLAKLGKGKAGKVESDKLGEFFEKIEQSGQRLHQLIESLLKLAEAAWADYSVLADDKLAAVPMAQLARQCCAMMESKAQQRGQTITLDDRASAAVVHGDEALLNQVLEYLIGNALRYSPEHTTVTVRLQDKPADVVAGAAKAGSLSMQVIDEGCGIPEKELGAIFEPFYQSSRTATGAGGTGLGLALCKTIVRRHKGEIVASNRPAGGAIFEVTLPAG